MVLGIDFTDTSKLYELMDNASRDTSLLVGENEEGERVFVDIQKDAIVTKTEQSNGWTRINIYGRDGIFSESYERK